MWATKRQSAVMKNEKHLCCRLIPSDSEEVKGKSSCCSWFRWVSQASIHVCCECRPSCQKSNNSENIRLSLQCGSRPAKHVRPSLHLLTFPCSGSEPIIWVLLVPGQSTWSLVIASVEALFWWRVWRTWLWSPSDEKYWLLKFDQSK